MFAGASVSTGTKNDQYSATHELESRWDFVISMMVGGGGGPGPAKKSLLPVFCSFCSTCLKTLRVIYLEQIG